MKERRSVFSRLLTRAACLLAAAILAAPFCAPRPNCAYADEPEGLAKPAWEGWFQARMNPAGLKRPISRLAACSVSIRA